MQLIACDGVFKSCPISSSHSKEECKSCYLNITSLLSKFNLPFINISTLLKKNEIQQSLDWVNSLDVYKYADVQFENMPIGKWIQPSLCAKFLCFEPDFSKKETHVSIRDFIYNVLIIHFAYKHLLNDFFPDHVVCYNANHLYYRAFFKISKYHNIPVLVHERGRKSDSFLFIDNGYGHHSAGRVEAWQQWKDIPLSYKECMEVKKYAFEREMSKNINLTPFYTFESDSDIYSRLKLSSLKKKKIISIFTSTAWELGRYKWDVPKRFNSYIDGISNIINQLKDAIIIIRHHPYMVGNSHVDTQIIPLLLKLNRQLPENVRVIMPTEEIKSYDLMWLSDAIFTLGSTTGIEAPLRGVATASNADTIYSLLGLVDTIKDPDYRYYAQKTINRTNKFDINDLRIAYRGFYTFFFRLSSYNFKSFGIRNNFQYDIRIKNLNELNPVNDPSLDIICDHILKKMPLFPSPSKTLTSVNNEEETAFLKKELDAIKSKRLKVNKRLNESQTVEPLISVIRIRQDGRKEPANTLLYQTLKKSRHKNIEFRNLEFCYFEEIKTFVQELRTAVDIANGDYIYIGTDNTHLDESFFSTAISFLEKPDHTNFHGYSSGAWLLDKNENLIDEMMTNRSQLITFQSIYTKLLELNVSAQILTFYIWKRSSFKDNFE